MERRPRAGQRVAHATRRPLATIHRRPASQKTPIVALMSALMTEGAERILAGSSPVTWPGPPGRRRRQRRQPASIPLYINTRVSLPTRGAYVIFCVSGRAVNPAGWLRSLSLFSSFSCLV